MTLPAKWWRDPSVFDLEKRAIFSKACDLFFLKFLI